MSAWRDKLLKVFLTEKAQESISWQPSFWAEPLNRNYKF